MPLAVCVSCTLPVCSRQVEQAGFGSRPRSPHRTPLATSSAIGVLSFKESNMNIDDNEDFEIFKPSVKSLVAKAEEYNKDTCNALYNWFIGEVGDEPLEAKLLIRWYVTPGGLRDPDERTILDLSSKIKVDMKLLSDIFRSTRFKDASKMLLTDTGFDDVSMKLVMDAVLEKALKGDISAAKLLFTMNGKINPVNNTKSKQVELSDMSDDELKQLLSKDN
jgi:hypothetical protein